VNGTAVNMLLVEDDLVDVMNVRRAFARAQIMSPLSVVGDGEEALAKLRDGTFPASRRLVILDLNLPRMNGIEFLQEVRSDPALAKLSVVVLTTSSEERDKVDAYEFNVAGYLVKPVGFVEFVELMTTLSRYWTHAEML